MNSMGSGYASLNVAAELRI